MTQPWARGWARRPPEVPANLAQPVIHCAPFPVPGALSHLALAVFLTPITGQGFLLCNSNIWFLAKVPRPGHLTTAGPHSYSRMCSRCSIYANTPFERFQVFFFLCNELLFLALLLAGSQMITEV